MKQIADFAPTRDLPLVIVSTTVWNVVLLLASYPAADWIGAVVLGYVAVWLSRFIIVQSVSLILGMLLKYLKRVAGQLNVELPDDKSAKSLPLWASALVSVFYVALTVSIFGIAIIATSQTVEFAGLASLNPLVQNISLYASVAAVSIGALYLVLQFLAIAWVERRAKRRAESRRRNLGHRSKAPNPDIEVMYGLTRQRPIPGLTQPALA